MKGTMVKSYPQHSWKYVAIDYFFNNELLDDIVPERNSPGRLLLHLIITRNRVPHKPIQDVVIGCYHPHARYMVKKVRVPEMKDCRVLWMAIRRRSGFSSTTHHHQQSSSSNMLNGEATATKLERFLNKENHTSEFTSPVGGHKIKNKCLEAVSFHL